MFHEGGAVSLIRYGSCYWKEASKNRPTGKKVATIMWSEMAWWASKSTNLEEYFRKAGKQQVLCEDIREGMALLFNLQSMTLSWQFTQKSLSFHSFILVVKQPPNVTNFGHTRYNSIRFQLGCFTTSFWPFLYALDTSIAIIYLWRGRMVECSHLGQLCNKLDVANCKQIWIWKNMSSLAILRTINLICQNGRYQGGPSPTDNFIVPKIKIQSECFSINKMSKHTSQSSPLRLENIYKCLETTSIWRVEKKISCKQIKEL